MNNVIYKATRLGDGSLRVLRNGQPLNPRQDLEKCNARNPHIIFECGTPGDATAQLALALLADVYQDDSFARKHYLRLSARWLRGLSVEGFEVSGEDIKRTMSEVMTD